MNFTDHGPNHVRVGRLMLTKHVRQGREGPWVDGWTTTMVRCDSDTDEELERVHFGGVALRPWWSEYAVTVGWRGARAPFPARYRWRYMKARARWFLAGRPPATPHGISVMDGCETETSAA